jgi:hypothetical protein
VVILVNHQCFRRLEGSIKQIARVDTNGAPLRERVEDVCDKNGERLELTEEGVEVRRGTVFVVQLEESVNFSQYPWLCGEATGKSSIGRLDVLTRLLADGCSEHERVPERYKGSLYVEIVPISFPVRIYPGVSLNQLRIHCGPMSPLRSLVGRRLRYKSDDGGEFSAAAQEAGTLSLDLLPRKKNGADISAYVLRQSPPKLSIFEIRGRPSPRITSSRSTPRMESSRSRLTVFTSSARSRG